MDKHIIEYDKSISNFLNTNYKNYSLETVHSRAIPSLIDGVKPGARKIMHAMFTGSLKDGKTYKLLALSGDTMKLSLYAHGDMSLNETIITLSKYFYNNLNPLEIDGQCGSLLCPNDAGSPRYLYIKKSKYADLIYKTDYDLLHFIEEEGQMVEPDFYLPIIPTVLTNFSIGIANGYAFHTMAYNPLNVVDSCINHISSKKNNILLTPYLRGIDNDTWHYIEGHWWSYGKYKCNQSKDLLTITGLPYDVTYEDFEKLLNKYQEKEYIKEYKNLSEDGKVLYEIQFPIKGLSTEIKRDPTTESLANKFKLIKQIPDDLLWVLDENNKLKYFESKYELLEYFTNWRLSIYTERKKKLVKILEEKYKNNTDLVKFIELVCKGTLKIRNRSKIDIKIDMDNYILPIELISTSMSKCTIEERDELLKQNEEIKKELEYIKNTTEKQMYLNDLTNLRKELVKDFPDNPTNVSSNLHVEIVGEVKQTKEDKELEKAKKQKVKEAKEKEKAKVAKEKEKNKKAKDKAKKQKEKEVLSKAKDKAKAQKIKENILKEKTALDKLKTKLAAAKIKKDKEKISELNNKIIEVKNKIDEYKNKLK